MDNTTFKPQTTLNNRTAKDIIEAAQHENTSHVEKMRSCTEAIRQVLGSNDFVNGEEVNYTDFSGDTSVLPHESYDFNIMRDNADIAIPYTKTSQEEILEVTGESSAISHHIYENPEYKSDEELHQAVIDETLKQREAFSTMNADELLDSQNGTATTISSTELYGCSDDLSPETKNRTGDFLDNLEALQSEQTIVEMVPESEIGNIPASDLITVEVVADSNAPTVPNKKESMASNDSTSSEPVSPVDNVPADTVAPVLSNNEKAKDTISLNTTEEKKFDTSGNAEIKTPEIKEALKEKYVLRQFKGHSNSPYLRFFKAVGSTEKDFINRSISQGDESAEIEAEKKIARLGTDLFTYCDFASGTAAKNLLVRKQVHLDKVTVATNKMIKDGSISFDDLTGDKRTAKDNLLSKRIRKRRVKSVLAVREQVLQNLKAQEILYQFAAEAGRYSPEQLALLKNDSFFNDASFGRQNRSLYSTYFRASETEMLKKLDPSTMSRKDLLKFDKNVKKAEELYQLRLKGAELSEKEIAFINAYHLNEKDKMVYNKAKSDILTHTNKKGEDIIGKVKGSGMKRKKYIGRKLSDKYERATSQTAETMALRAIETGVNTLWTAKDVIKGSAIVSYKVNVAIIKWVVVPVHKLTNKYILRPAADALKEFIATEKANIQNSKWYQDTKQQIANKKKEFEETKVGKKYTEVKQARAEKKEARGKEKEAKNKDKRAKREKKAAKSNARKAKLGKIGRVVSAPIKFVTLPFRGIEEIIAAIGNKIKSMLIVPGLIALAILVPVIFCLSMFAKYSNGSSPFSGLYNEFILAGENADTGLNYVYEWNETMEGWQEDIDKDIKTAATKKPHTCKDNAIFGEDTTCSVCGAFILGLTDADAVDSEGLKNEEVYYDTKIYAYGSPKSADDPTADWYHNSSASIDTSLLNGYRIYYLDASGKVIASSTTNIKDILCLMTMMRENMFTVELEDPTENADPEKVDKHVRKTLDWLWDRFQPIITTKVSDVYHTEYSTDTFPKDGGKYKCTDDNFYTKYNTAVGEGVKMYDTVAPQQKETPTVDGYICSGKGCKYEEWFEWSDYTICGKTQHTHSWGCNSRDCYHTHTETCRTNGCTHTHNSACCSKSYHRHSTTNGCYKKIWYRKYYCPGEHEALHCSYGYRDLNVYVTTFKIGDIIKLRAADNSVAGGEDYATFTNTFLNRKLGTFDNNWFYDYPGFPTSLFLNNSAGSRFTNRLEWKGDTFLYFSVPSEFSRDDTEFSDSLKYYKRTINLLDAYKKDYISEKFFYDALTNLTEGAIDDEFSGFNVFDYARHDEMTATYGLESTMGFKICPNTEFNSENRQDGGGIAEHGCAGGIEWLYRLYTADWMEAYGVDSYGITSIEGNNTLDSDSIDNFLNQIDTYYTDDGGISFQRKNMVRRVLNSVGRIPYWSGGQPTSRIYNSRWGRTAVASDVNYEENIAAGRTSFGLDAMGYFRYMYWSTVGRQPNYTPKSFYETSGIQEISYSELKPGDIGFINPPTADFNVIGIFVGYENGIAKWVYMDKAAGTVVLTNGGSVSGEGTQGSFGYYYKFLN